MIDLIHLFTGFVKSYRSLNLRFGAQHETMARWTTAEIGWFADLGERLGYYALQEKDVFHARQNVDLAWVDPFTGSVVLHLERENNPLGIHKTIAKRLLPGNRERARACIGIFDETTPEHQDTISESARKAFPRARGCDQALLICYSRIPSMTDAAKGTLLRYEMEWPVRGFYLSRYKKAMWIEARCTTDRNYYYTMHLVEPAMSPPYRMRGRIV